MSRRRLRIGLVVSALALVGAGVATRVTHPVDVIVMWRSVSLREAGDALADGHTMIAASGRGILLSPDNLLLGPLPTWGAVCLVLGFLLLVMLCVVPDPRDIPRWAAPLFLVLWVLQAAGITRIGRWGSDVPLVPGLSLLTQPAALASRWWGIVLLALTVVGIAVGSRWRRGTRVVALSPTPQPEP